jgi:hypothetical protein
MTMWTSDALARIGTAEESQLASLRSDGTLRCARTIWVVRDGDDIYVRSVNGVTSAWYRGTRTRHEGHIHAPYPLVPGHMIAGIVAAVGSEVTAEEFEARADEQVDGASGGPWRGGGRPRRGRSSRREAPNGRTAGQTVTIRRER